jgi:peptidoglycan DL-endopeptidase CwlO
MRGWQRGLTGFSAVLLALTLLPSAQAQNSVSGKRKEAARLAARIEATTAKLEVLNEDFLVATDRLATLQKRLVRAEALERRSSKRIAALKIQLREQGLRVFAIPAGSSFDALEGAASIAEVERKLVIGEQRTQRLADAADQLRAERADNASSAKRLTDARREAKAAKATVAAKLKNSDQVLSELESLEQQVSAELATLIEADRKAREVAERNRLEAAAKRAREQAKARLDQRRRAERDAVLRRRKPTKAGQSRQSSRTSAGSAAIARPLPSLRETARERRTRLEREGRDAQTRGQTPAQTDLPARAPTKAKELRDLEVDAGLVEVGGSPGAQKAVAVAMSQLGKPYIWAAEGPGGFDCSGLMLYAWRASGKNLPHSSRIQFASTVRVPLEQRKPGDLLFYGRPIHHVGMYIGNDQMVEAPHRGARVRVKSIFRRDLVGVGRVK